MPGQWTRKPAYAVWFFLFFFGYGLQIRARGSGLTGARLQASQGRDSKSHPDFVKIESNLVYGKAAAKRYLFGLIIIMV